MTHPLHGAMVSEARQVHLGHTRLVGLGGSHQSPLAGTKYLQRLQHIDRTHNNHLLLLE